MLSCTEENGRVINTTPWDRTSSFESLGSAWRIIATSFAKRRAEAHSSTAWMLSLKLAGRPLAGSSTDFPSYSSKSLAGVDEELVLVSSIHVVDSPAFVSERIIAESLIQKEHLNG